MTGNQDKYTVEEIRCKRSIAGPGSWTYSAGAAVITPDGREYYVLANEYRSGWHFTVSESDVYEWLAAPDRYDRIEDVDMGPFISRLFAGTEIPPDPEDPERESVRYLEFYTSLAETKASPYSRVFETLADVIMRLREG